jgi:very-short-patch-repair endonuclease
VAERDAVQDKALKALGYEVIRVTSDELKNQSSDAVYQILVTKSAILGVRYGICPHSLNV